MSYTPSKRQELSTSCPAGGVWWSCGYGTYFVGCCARDPCDVTCAQGNLYPGGFNPTTYGDFPDATCGTGSKFYTCAAGDTFWGCCKTNACSQNGCPDGDLEPAIMNRDDQRSAYHATGGSALTSATSTSTSRISIADASTTPTASPQPAHKPPVAAIAGGAAGGAFALAVVVGLLVYYCCYAKKKSRKKDGDTVGRGQSGPPDVRIENSKHKGVQPHDAPPRYTSPNPDPYPPHASPYYTHARHQQYSPEPQELPIGPDSPVPIVRKSLYGHGHGPSELPGSVTRSELETPNASPKRQQMPFTPQQPSPLDPQTEFAQQRSSPMSPPTQFVPHSPPRNVRNVQLHDGEQRWAAPQNWQFSPTESETGGLGVQSMYGWRGDMRE